MRPSTQGRASRSLRVGRMTSRTDGHPVPTQPGRFRITHVDTVPAPMPGPILVTGGAGFIGSHVVDALVDPRHAVRSLDTLLAAAHREKPSYLNPAAEYVEGDLRDAETVARAVDGVAAVCHQAAMVGLGTDIGDIADYVAHNDLGTAVLLKALAARGYTGPLVLASSMVVYGEGRYACPEHGIVRPGPRHPADLDAGEFEPPCPFCGRALVP